MLKKVQEESGKICQKVAEKFGSTKNLGQRVLDEIIQNDKELINARNPEGIIDTTEMLEKSGNILKEQGLKLIEAGQRNIDGSTYQALSIAKQNEGIVLDQMVKQSFFSKYKRQLFGLVAIIAIAGISYYIYKKIKGKNEERKPNLKNFKMPVLPKHDDLSEISSTFTISSKQVAELEQAYGCQISYHLMVEPVLALCCKKRNYEKIVIQAWIDQHGICPFCQQELTRQLLVPNQALKMGIKIYRKQLEKRGLKYQQQRIREDGLE